MVIVDRVKIFNYILLTIILLPITLSNCLPPSYLGDDPNEIIYENHIDIKEGYYTYNSTHVGFIIVCYANIRTRRDNPSLPRNEFQICLDVEEGRGDNRLLVYFRGADIIITAHDGKVYYWSGGGFWGEWRENRTATVHVAVSGQNITITCRLSDIQYERISGDLKVGFISSLTKVRRATMLNKGLDRAPDSGWYIVEGGIPDIGLVENLVATLFGSFLAYKVYRAHKRLWRD